MPGGGVESVFSTQAIGALRPRFHRQSYTLNLLRKRKSKAGSNQKQLKRQDNGERKLTAFGE
ncbi:MAG: hypothetical protein DMG05_23230 [Acidobacteria bacterium]|nr:MAG: hypothetical protein DMG05_23230 [Acidobacteriota bacterium]